MKRRWVLPLIMIVSAASAAGPWQDWTPVVDSAETTVAQYYKRQHPAADIDLKVSAPDDRLKLSACDKNLTIDLSNPPENGGNLSIHVRCSGETPWAIYLKGEVNIWTAILVARHTLPRGHRLQASDMTLTKINITKARSGVLYRPDDADGKELRRGLEAGKPIKIRDLIEPMVIKRGDRVQIAARAEGLQVLMTGTALRNGRLGEQIPISNDRSNRKLRAKVIAQGHVEVPF